MLAVQTISKGVLWNTIKDKIFLQNTRHLLSLFTTKRIELGQMHARENKLSKSTRKRMLL